ncbi:hypothetical protein CWE13_03925 [Aliidiomarina shirensis]|uniref:Toxin co-regulated pilus biosynthesis protein Q C-terminal domain-containing protein n=1 Tax=Aliidiomarina shirensis TaxID=1048642 RepID=A0A432WYG0_9GAMM|nr:hypothetical protein [Aliidiomarina shirensis]RUO38789.1 hypothetical protein CWE13_03925 [Aliidiomarina shirensis]
MYPNLRKVSVSSFFLIIMLASPNALAFGLPTCPPLNIQTSGATGTAILESSPWAQLELKPGLLRPQLEKLLKQHWGIQNVVWYAEDGHYWPTHYSLRAATWDELLETLIAPYHIKVTLHANHTAVVDYLSDTKRGL